MSSKATNNIYGSHSDLVMESFECFHWASNRQVQIWFRGVATKRHFPTEDVLQKLSKRKRLRKTKYGRINVYAIPRKTKGELEESWKIYHGLGCTEALMRFYRSDTDCEIIPEREFRGMGSVPEWGIRYPNGSLLLGEFSTKSNVTYSTIMPGKFRAYRDNLPKIEEAFGSRAVVVFILDIPRDQVAKRIGIWKPDGPYFFTDYETFQKVPIGLQLKAPIYFWTDGKEYSLA